MKIQKKILLLLCVIVIMFAIASPCAAVNYNNTESGIGLSQDDKTIRHRVKKRESLSRILKKYKMSLSNFLISNSKHVNSNLDLSIGEELYLEKRYIGTATKTEISRQINAHIKMIARKKESADLRESHFEKESIELQDKHIKKDSVDLQDNNVKKDSVDLQDNYIEKESVDLRGLYIKKDSVEYQDIYIKRDSTDLQGIYFERDSVSLRNRDIEKEKYISDLSLADKYLKIYADNALVPLKAWDNNIKIAILLPLTDSNDKIDKDFESFYKGAILALDSLKKAGISALVDVYDTGKGLNVINELIYGGNLDDMNIIIGPIYNDQFTIFAEYLKGKGIILVSPLASVEPDYDFIYQLAPSQKKRFEKIKDYAQNKTILFYSHGDTENETFFVDIIKDATEVNALEYDNEMDDEDIIKYFSPDSPNLVVISSNKKNDIEMLLSKVMSIKNKYRDYDIEVIGSPEFGRIDESKRADFFRANTHFTTSYHYDRQNKLTLEFDARYIDMFGEVPTLYSYRAYDVMMMFINMMNIYGDSFKEDINEQLTRILQVNYRFIQEKNRGKYINQEWMLVNYRPNYIITTK